MENILTNIWLFALKLILHSFKIKPNFIFNKLKILLILNFIACIKTELNKCKSLWPNVNERNALKPINS